MSSACFRRWLMTGASFFSSFRVKAALSVELLHQAGSAYEARNPPPLPTIAARANYDPCRRRQKVPVAREQRKLAAILADVVGYSRLMGRETAERLTCGGGWTPFPLKVCVSFALKALLIETICKHEALPCMETGKIAQTPTASWRLLRVSLMECDYCHTR